MSTPNLSVFRGGPGSGWRALNWFLGGAKRVIAPGAIGAAIARAEGRSGRAHFVVAQPEAAAFVSRLTRFRSQGSDRHRHTVRRCMDPARPVVAVWVAGRARRPDAGGFSRRREDRQ